MSGRTVMRVGIDATPRVAMVGLAFAALAAITAGCKVEAFCFDDCGEETSGEGGSPGTGGGGTTGSFSTGQSTTGAFMSGSGGGMECTPTNGGEELCDGVDNDCNGVIDDADFTSPKFCGVCGNSCYLENVDPATVDCMPSGEGQPGLCVGECAQDYFDLDGDGACEYYCVQAALDDTLCNGADDDCDNLFDEDVDFCSAGACGQCGRTCDVVSGTGTCVKDDPMAATCTTANTSCAIAACDADHYDLDGLYETGCEYACALTNGGVEICGDGVDNDCDGKIDSADDLSGDAAIGVSCQGDPDGLCADPVHAGLTECVDGQVKCVGMEVLREGEKDETCNGVDDDCDGTADNNLTDVGASCGASNIFPCTFGTTQCVNGALACVGEIGPKTESCNGVDDDCDGMIDLANGMQPGDVGGACGEYPAAPPGSMSPCKAGTKACVGGTVQCVGAVGPTSTQDGCNLDSNCDGALTGQPNLTADVKNCGACGNDCYQGAVNEIYACVSGSCVRQGCLAGYYDLDSDGTCEYQCTFFSAQEVCNGVDDDCDGMVDENPLTPSKVSVCGTSPAASRPECTTGVTLSCTNGAWSCSFPANVCNPTCATAVEVCDGLDNDCDGVWNENVPDFGAACASDDGQALSHGACRATGTKVCATANTTSCNAVKADCALLPGGCTELCDGKDNDCDGTIDETYQAKGTDALNFVRPTVTKIGASLWTYSYEASRPNATVQSPGTGNGYWTQTVDVPPGVTLDKTRSCSVSGKVPWQNVTPLEAEQTCTQMGGKLCEIGEWQSACRVNSNAATKNCTWGYNPFDAACTTASTATKYCNLGAYDGNSMTAGDQDVLLPTASTTLLQNCFASWSGLQANVAVPVNGNGLDKVFDITGNVREFAKVAGSNPAVYRVMGGAFNSQSEDGSACTFTFYSVDDEFKYFDTGFRCCFTTNPTQ